MIKWFAEATCDEMWGEKDGGYGMNPCEEKTEVTLTLKAQRVIDIEVPDGWTIRYRGNDDSQNDSTRPDLDGDEVRVLCPKHRTSGY